MLVVVVVIAPMEFTTEKARTGSSSQSRSALKKGLEALLLGRERRVSVGMAAVAGSVFSTSGSEREEGTGMVGTQGTVTVHSSSSWWWVSMDPGEKQHCPKKARVLTSSKMKERPAEAVPPWLDGVWVCVVVAWSLWRRDRVRVGGGREGG